MYLLIDKTQFLEQWCIVHNKIDSVVYRLN